MKKETFHEGINPDGSPHSVWKGRYYMVRDKHEPLDSGMGTPGRQLRRGALASMRSDSALITLKPGCSSFAENCSLHETRHRRLRRAEQTSACSITLAAQP